MLKSLGITDHRFKKRCIISFLNISFSSFGFSHIELVMDLRNIPFHLGVQLVLVGVQLVLVGELLQNKRHLLYLTCIIAGSALWCSWRRRNWRRRS
jgi:hypothetical protein